MIIIQAVLSEELFYEQYTVKPNHLTNNEAFGGMYETYGEELEYIQKVNKETPEVLWTIIDEGDHLYFVSGYHWINRLGYIITNEPWVVFTEVELDKIE